MENIVVHGAAISDYSGEGLFRIGQRVEWIPPADIPLEDFNCLTGTIVSAMTKFARTPFNRLIVYRVWLDEGLWKLPILQQDRYVSAISSQLKEAT